jgi:hypothetical protein
MPSSVLSHLELEPIVFHSRTFLGFPLCVSIPHIKYDNKGFITHSSLYFADDVENRSEIFILVHTATDSYYIYDMYVSKTTNGQQKEAQGEVVIYYSPQGIQQVIVSNVPNGCIRTLPNVSFDIYPQDYIHLITNL